MFRGFCAFVCDDCGHKFEGDGLRVDGNSLYCSSEMP
jgi:hypothetical protein